MYTVNLEWIFNSNEYELNGSVTTIFQITNEEYYIIDRINNADQFELAEIEQKINGYKEYDIGEISEEINDCDESELIDLRDEILHMYIRKLEDESELSYSYMASCYLDELELDIDGDDVEEWEEFYKVVFEEKLIEEYGGYSLFMDENIVIIKDENDKTVYMSENDIYKDFM